MNMDKDSDQLKSAPMSRRRVLFVTTALMLFLLLPVMSACKKNQSLTGTWELISSQEEGYVAGMLFEFSSDGILYISAGTAPIPSDDQVSLQKMQANDRLTYTSSRSGNLKILLKLNNSETISFSMTYDIENDRLVITDRDDVQLEFRRVR
jgi:hypothetical protein